MRKAGIYFRGDLNSSGRRIVYPRCSSGT
jgi:hypothetical protein